MNLTFIGGGLLLKKLIIGIQKYNVNFNVALSKRHALEHISERETLSNSLKKLGVLFHVFVSRDDFESQMKSIIPDPDLILCLGPSWIFSKNFVQKYQNKLFNINCIPVPKFRGGAHFTWQILQTNYEISIVIQKITNQLDRGEIVFRTDSQLKKSKPKPIDYFEAYENILPSSIKKFTDLFVCSNFQKSTNFCEIEKDIQFFPRLNTDIHGWINWNWDGLSIERFVRAFSNPYPGAKTFCGKKDLRILDVHFSSGEKNHPFCYGLIVNNFEAVPSVIVSDGIISLIKYKSEKPLLVGSRLYTPNKFLEEAKQNGIKYD